MWCNFQPFLEANRSYPSAASCTLLNDQIPKLFVQGHVY